MKKVVCLLLVLVLAFSLTACMEDGTVSQGDAVANSDVANKPANDNKLGDYEVVIKECRLAEDFEGKAVAIIKIGFTNNDDDAAAFYTSITCEVYQNGIGLNECIFVDDSAKYDGDNQTKEIKPGATLDVELAYELNDETTDIEVELSEWISFSDKKITKTFTIA